MQYKKRGQISTEYLMVIAFVLFIVLSVLGIAFTYSAQIKDSMKFNQIETFSQKVLSEAESVYYAGAPSKTSVRTYLPEGITNISTDSYYLVFTVSTSSGENVVAYKSNVILEGDLNTYSGVRIIYLNATANSVILSG